MTTKILAFSGALRKASTNTALVRAAKQLAPEGVEIEIYDGIAACPSSTRTWRPTSRPWSPTSAPRSPPPTAS